MQNAEVKQGPADVAKRMRVCVGHSLCVSLLQSEAGLLLLVSEDALSQQVVRGCDVVISVSLQCSATHRDITLSTH